MPDDPDSADARADGLDTADEDRFDAIASMARAFWPSRVLLTAVELDLFSLLGNRRRSLAQLAGDAEADRRGMELLANALVALGLLSLDNGHYENSPLSRRFLDRASDEYRGHVVRLAGWWWTRGSALTDVVRTGEAVDGPPSELVEDFTLAMHEGKPDAGERLVAKLDLHGVRRIVDLGCGAGTFAEALAQALPEAHVVCVDRAEVLAVARDRLPEELLDERISMVPRDFLADGIPLAGDRPGPYDLAVVSSVLHLLSEEENESLLGRIHDSLEPGGRIAIRDFLVDDEGSDPVEAALFAVSMLVSTRGGRCYSYPKVKKWLHGAGFGEVELDEFEGPVGLITARRA